MYLTAHARAMFYCPCIPSILCARASSLESDVSGLEADVADLMGDVADLQGKSGSTTNYIIGAVIGLIIGAVARARFSFA